MASEGNGQIIKFTETFEVTRKAGSYKRFISRIRKLVAQKDIRLTGVPVLYPDQEVRKTWFDIILTANNNSKITLRIRYGDLYLIGFCTSGQWVEFNDNTEHFDGATLLAYSSDYPNNIMVHAAVKVGLKSLNTAITLLANYDLRNGEENKIALYCLMTMFPEAFRFTTVENFVDERIRNGQDSPISNEIVELVKNWGKLSMQMRRSNRFASFEMTIGIDNAQDAAQKLGLILWSTEKVPKPSPDFFKVMEYISEGRDLVEIFWVQVQNIDNKNHGYFYGDITVSDGSNTPDCIFNPDRALNITPGDYLPLVGPKRAISAYDSFCIDVSLKNGDDNKNKSDTASEATGQITWNYLADNVYNQPVSAKVEVKNCLIAVNYAVYCNSVTATLEVMLIKGDSTKVYGTLLASNTCSNQDITLFNKTSDTSVDIMPQQTIPLLRSLVVIPRHSSIKIVADLRHNKDTNSDNKDRSKSSTGKVAEDLYSIAKGSLTFMAATSGSNTGIIEGKCGSVEVKITWSSG